jgi:hypothetical protein
MSSVFSSIQQVGQVQPKSLHGSVGMISQVQQEVGAIAGRHNKYHGSKMTPKK